MQARFARRADAGGDRPGGAAPCRPGSSGPGAAERPFGTGDRARRPGGRGTTHFGYPAGVRKRRLRLRDPSISLESREAASGDHPGRSNPTPLIATIVTYLNRSNAPRRLE